ncbi:alcohol dehydrogenase catalytic domain-containing protein [Candidatus Caldatribacterium saccharofermentans]|uniref:alcohol dehydrogenase catalytic domain-containing protein n=1 Tax=Candidatus Caldatribacterium saccharofermentans TaxID=1454753 RepID=UPI003D0000A3
MEYLQELPAKMKAVVNYAPFDFRLEEVDVPSIGPGEVLIKVGGCGICAGDVKTFHGAKRIWGGDGQPPYVQPPVIPGHEFYGQVVALGDGAGEKYGLSLGDWVVSEQIIPCGACRFCKRGEYWMCEVHYIYGYQKGASDGGFAEYAKLPKNAINYKLPPGFPLKVAPYVEPLACAIHAVERAEIQLEDVVVIAGMGALGLGMLQVAKLKNPQLLIAIDVVEKRLELAKKLGADIVMNPEKIDVVAEVKKLTDGYGCDVYIHASGHPKGVIQGLQMIRRLGRYVEFSVFNEPTTVDWSIIGDVKELDIRGAHLSPYTYPLAISLLHRGIVKAEEIITHELPLEEFKKGLEIAENSRVSIRVVLRP